MTEELSVDIFFVNDVYSERGVRGRGGWLNCAAALNNMRKGTERSLFLCAGDVLGGSAMCEATKGQHVVQLLNEMRLDACCLGNHEFDYGDALLLDRMRESNFPWLCSNAWLQNRWFPGESPLDPSVDPDEKRLIAQDIVVFERNGVRLGLFGLCTEATPTMAYPDHVEFENVFAAAERSIESLEQLGNVDVVLALTHLNFAQDKLLAKRFAGRIHLILGGHDHEPLTFVTSCSRTVVLKAGFNCNWLCKASISCVSGGEVDIAWRMDPLLDRHWRQHHDAALEAVLQGHEASILGGASAAIRNEVLRAKLSCDLDARTHTVRTHNSTFAALVADAMMWWGESSVHSPTVALINGGFIRSDHLYTAGSGLTVGQLEDAMPFPKAIVVAEVSNLVELLNFMLRHAPEPAGCFPHVSRGCTVSINPTVGNTVDKVTISSDSRSLEITAASPSKPLAIVTSEFLARGGDGCPSFVRICDTGPRISQIVIDYLKNNPFIGFDVEPRILNLP